MKGLGRVDGRLLVWGWVRGRVAVMRSSVRHGGPETSIQEPAVDEGRLTILSVQCPWLEVVRLSGCFVVHVNGCSRLR